MPSNPTRPADLVPFREAVRAWLLISLQTFGGPAGQISVMQRTLVEERRWIGQQRFLHALSYCTLLPGPEAQQLAIYTGWLLNGLRGGLVAGTLFVLPGLLALLALSALYVAFGETAVGEALFLGVAPAVLAIVAQAVVRVSGKALTGPGSLAIAVAAFVALAVFRMPFPAIVALAAVAGWALGRWAPTGGGRHPATDAEADAAEPPLVPDDLLHHEAPSRGRTARVLLVGVLAWAVPVVAFALLTGRDSVFTDQALFFTGAALVTFGGAYAVLSYVAQQAVEVYRWLAPGEMVRGLALAETTPGPLVMVVLFVAFLGAYRDPGALNPWAAALLATLLVTWVTFVPSFVLVLVGAPWVERLRGNASLAAALAGITAAVVGVIANLAVFFALHTLFARTVFAEAGPVSVELPVLASVRLDAMLVGVVAALLLFRVRWSVLRTLGGCALLGLAISAARALAG
ncbi:MAG: chromate efflux transporter [Dermatophilaceae bacterium]